MPHPLPSLSGMRAFEAAARHLSVTLAADELHVTPGAVSLQIRELEERLGVQLFERRPRRLSLTVAGAGYFASLRTAFRLMREATETLLAQTRRPTLVISCTPSFAAQWLMPRITAFEEHVPDVDIRINASNRIANFERDGIDVAIRHGLGRYEGLSSERLLDDDLVPVLAATLFARKPARRPSDLADHVLIHDVHREDWRLWLEAAGAPTTNASRGPVFTNSNGAIEAARAGNGVALVRPSLVVRELAEGQLLAPFKQGVATSLAYHLVYPPAALDRPVVAAFRAWLLAQAQDG